MKLLIKLYVYIQAVVETISIRLSRPSTAAIAEAERDVAAGRTIEFSNWGCGL